MSKLSLYNNRILKLSNVLKCEMQIKREDFDLGVAIEQMQSFIRSKGAMQVGPLIQYTKTYVDEDNKIEMEIVLMLQCNHYIHNVEAPYHMEAVIRIPNCMYCRYNGPEEKMGFAYQKIQIEAFENDIPLKGDSYTIFVDENEENETVITDVFMERAD